LYGIVDASRLSELPYESHALFDLGITILAV